MDDFAYRIEYVVKLYLTSMFLYNLIIAPIEMIVDWVFTFFYTKLHMLGTIGAIYGVSIVINFLALPLYNIADALQEKERVISKKLEYRVKRIKKAFKGDEQFMMLSEYYRQNNYHPLYTLRSSLSILIEIPFFIAAYHYLSHSSALENAAVFSWITDLSSPDYLLAFHIGSKMVRINILPIVMTLINFISGYIYTRNSTLRDKIQLYAMGIFFLVILYDSPSGLVIYWICNNIFSLVKTIILKTKHPNRNGRIVVGVFLLGLVVFLFNIRKKYSYVLFVLALVVAIWPYIWKLLYRVFKGLKDFNEDANVSGFLAILLLSGVGLTLLCGLVLPSSAIATSPIEFSFIGNTDNPASYVWRSLIVFTGLFVFWPFCIYKMFGTKVKKWETILLLIAFIGALTNAFVFKSNYGTLDSQFFFVDNIDLKQVSTLNIIGPIAVLLASLLLFYLLYRYKKLYYMTFAFISICLAECIVGGINLSKIGSTFNEYQRNLEINNANSSGSMDSAGDIESVFHLSKDGKNVIFLFLDRGYGPFLPYALEQLPELKEQLKGFVYYPNTVSFGINTATGSPAMMGGYEYTPEGMNARSNDLLVDKHNEATLLSPVIFEDAGYSITVADPPLPNYSWVGDLSAFNILDNANVMEILGRYSDIYKKEFGVVSRDNNDEVTYKEARNFSMLQAIAPFARNFCNESFRSKDNIESYEANAFYTNYPSLYYFKNLTDFNADGDQYIFIGNNMPHAPAFMNSDFTALAKKDFSLYKMPSTQDTVLAHYCSFVAAMKQIGLWLDYLRDNGVYDNTRIVIVADHGIYDTLNYDKYSGFKPLLMFKDFDSNDDLQFDDAFMTNADANFLVRNGLPVSNINPFTGNTLEENKSDGINVYSMNQEGFDKIRTQFSHVKEANGFHVIPGDISNDSNWIPLSEWNNQNGGNR